MKVLVENVRGFAGSHSLEIKPLTILVGENSSGKTTILSVIAAVLQSDFPSIDSFNRSPFELGGYDTIATFRGGKYGRADNFTIGWEGETENQTYSIKANYKSFQGIPRIFSLKIYLGNSNMELSFSDGGWELKASATNKKKSIALHSKGTSDGHKPFSISDLNYIIFRSLREQQERDAKEGISPDEEALEALYRIAFSVTGQRPRVTSLAPLRTRPRRTYDELIEEFKPEGDHVPLVLARFLTGTSARDKAILGSIERFGKNSGLFDQLKVKRMGNKPSDPFQLRVKTTGPDANLIDVGYGVSQALPIVVDSLTSGRNDNVVLVQQPEVHLHPKAQAALGTFFAELVSGQPNSSRRFVIETHSDYLVDRVRIAVAEKIIRPDQISIIFLEKQGLDVQLHQLRLDSQGNIVDAPGKYRQFFLQEEVRLMTRGG